MTTANTFIARKPVAVLGWDSNGAQTTEPARTVRRDAQLPGYWLVRFASGNMLCVHESRMRAA